MSSRFEPAKLLFVGTAFLDAETMPSKGRLLIFQVNTKENRLELLKEIDLSGSVQALSSLRENHKFLVVG